MQPNDSASNIGSENYSRLSFHSCNSASLCACNKEKDNWGCKLNFAEAEEKAYAEPDKSKMFQTLDETGPDQDRVDSINHSLLTKKNKLDYYVIRRTMKEWFI